MVCSSWDNTTDRSAVADIFSRSGIMTAAPTPDLTNLGCEVVSAEIPPAGQPSGGPWDPDVEA